MQLFGNLFEMQLFGQLFEMVLQQMFLVMQLFGSVFEIQRFGSLFEMQRFDKQLFVTSTLIYHKLIYYRSTIDRLTLLDNLYTD